VGGAGAVGAYDAGFALRLVTVRWLGMFLADPLAVPRADILARGRHTGRPPRFAMMPAAAEAASSAAPMAIRAICQPGMPPTTTTWIPAPGGGSGGCLSQPGGRGGNGSASAAGATAATASRAPASPARIAARRRIRFMTSSSGSCSIG
jgi:hypothetical protein